MTTEAVGTMPGRTADDRPTQDAIVIEQVSKKYAGAIALAPLTLRIQRGERVALVGPSGSGKTTLLNLLSGTITPDEGRVYLHGQLLNELQPGRQLARLVGIMHQQFDLVDNLAVVHNVLAGRLGEWGLLRSLFSLIIPQDIALAKQALERVGLLNKIFTRTSQLSGGEQQRVALARLLIQNPQIILADEPVSSLDPARAKDLILLLIDIVREQKVTLVASLHSVHHLQYFSRVIALRNGQLYFDLPAEQVRQSDLDALYELEETKEEHGND